MAKDKTAKASKSSNRWFYLAVFLLIFSVVFAILDQMKDRWFVFEPNRLQQIAKGVLAKNHNNTKDMMKALVADLNV